MNIKLISQKWLDTKQNQDDLAQRTISINKLIRAKHKRFYSLQSQINSEIQELQEKLSIIEVQHQLLENDKRAIEFDLLKALEGKQ